MASFVALTTLLSRELIRFLIAWTVLFGGLGALLGKLKSLTRKGFVYGLLWGPFGLCVILLKQPSPDHQRKMEAARRRLEPGERLLMRAGLAASLLIAAVWVGSAVIHASYVRAYNPPRPVVVPKSWSAQGVSLQYVFKLELRDSVFVLRDTLWATGPKARMRADDTPGLHIATKARNAAGLIPGKLIPWLEGVPPRYIEIPLWMPLLLFAIPTAHLSWRNRPFPSDSCQKCGYDLTGNVSGTCPECGGQKRG